MSNIIFHVTARNIEEARQKIRESGIMGDEVTIQMPHLITEVHLTQKENEATPEPQPEEEQPKVAPEPQPEEEQPKAEPVKIKLEDVRAAANAYRDKHGIEKLREIFKKHGGEKLKDIPQANYAALLEDIS
jgi:hypothetical protein